jgi:hypothetical protein
MNTATSGSTGKRTVRITAFCVALLLLITAFPLTAGAATSTIGVWQETDIRATAGTVWLSGFAFLQTGIKASQVQVVSDNPSVVQVIGKYIKDSNSISTGFVMFRNSGKPGTAHVTVSSIDPELTFSAITANFTVTESVQKVMVKTTQVYCSPYFNLKRGKSLTLKAYPVATKTNQTGSSAVDALPYQVAASKISFKTSNKKVATVTKSGVVKVPKKAKVGKKATITVKYGGKSYKLKIRVVKKGGKIKTFTRSASLSASQQVYTGAQAIFAYSGSFTGTPYDKVKWTSSNPAVASVSADGFFVAKSVGKTTIKAKMGKKTITHTVTVVDPSVLLAVALGL